MDAPEPLGNPVTLTHYLDANLYHDMLTGRSVTAILHMMNQTPLYAFTKKQLICQEKIGFRIPTARNIFKVGTNVG